MSSEKQNMAKEILIHYFKNCWQGTGRDWSFQYEKDICMAVDLIAEGAKEAFLEELRQTGSPVKSEADREWER